MLQSVEKPRRRICVGHVVLQLDTGGMEKLLVEFSRHTDRKKFDLRFLCISCRGKLAGAIEAHGWPVTSMNEPAGLRIGMILRMAQTFRRWGVDVVHTHNTKPFLYAAPAAKLAHVPGLIQTRHGQPYQATRRRIIAFRLASMVADRVVCVSDDARRLTAWNGVAERKLQTLWNGIDLARFGYSGPRDNGPAVMVARLSPEKDTSNLIRATAAIVRQCPNFRLQIAGAGECSDDLKRLVAELNLNSNVHFLGEVGDVPSLLQSASLFILPSLTEGLSLTLLEAMAVGLPIVATAVGGNAEVVINGRTGFLVPKANPAALAAAILHLVANPELGRRLGQASRARVERHFDVRMMVRQYERLYENILSRQNRSLGCQ